MAQIDGSNTKRIEMVEGALSALYGLNAVGVAYELENGEIIYVPESS